MSSSSVPGMQYPTLKAMSAGTPRDSAIADQNANSAKLARLNKLSGGERRGRIHSRGGASSSTITVPQFQMGYKPTGGPGQDPNSIVQQNSQTSTQMNANSVYDSNATKGGNKYKWGCHSGGKKSRNSKQSRKTKSKKSRKTKSKKSRKCRKNC